MWILWAIVFGILFGGITSVLLSIYRTGWMGLSKTLGRYRAIFITRTYYQPEASELASQKVPYAPGLALGWLVLLNWPGQLPGLG
ncbi:hypothetical protein GCM10023333_11980 [Ferrimonas pelagia]|uniref:Uncharacterized protein n=2 Tax=Ferrimonas pelagia TaxID=1177826 RepID=A0ABP9EL00_9GAMM